ncbi:hypothetical protein LOTGIDRAFT_118767 [Lottia gigantea]|uniref:BPTI/Kunitz inhibitor domain-containing protein n=1 Tax=Lottia gigantea TaxID=225164 RepID=V4ABS3_LOTGI|nr:hypothetical protein LOTGIDRAFT_118767 [Lottia gigantea]ESO94267.1 hypothetical protein LOTGIDRAFT_118767 [Lottia gigantea]
MFTLASCRLPAAVGSCHLDYKVKWFYDENSGNCRRFWYGGCGGNENRFSTRVECVKHCLQRCKLDQDRGTCGNFTLRFYFDSSSITCEKFWYGGCKGNDNRFLTQQECLEACKVTSSHTAPGRGR